MKPKVPKIVIGLVLAVLIVTAYILGYLTGYADRKAQYAVVYVDRDDADSATNGTARTSHEPYATRANPIPNGVR